MCENKEIKKCVKELNVCFDKLYKCFCKGKFCKECPFDELYCDCLLSRLQDLIEDLKEKKIKL